MNLQRSHLRWGVWALTLAALLWVLWPAWQRWQAHPQALRQLAQQRQSMLLGQQEVETLLKKPVPSPVEAQALIQAISKQHLGSTPIALPGQGLQIRFSQVGAQPLALAWQEIRTQTSASVTHADLTAQGALWSGTLVLQLAQKP